MRPLLHGASILAVATRLPDGSESPLLSGSPADHVMLHSTTFSKMWLDPIPPAGREQALAYLATGDVIEFLFCASNEAGPWLVAMNSDALQELGLYEPALLHAFTGTRTNNHGFSFSTIVELFEKADPVRLRAAGDPLPGKGPFKVYRGVAGRGPARRVRGFSWTASPERASWFAHRFDSFLHNPTVFSITVWEPDILAYVKDREEEEFVILPSSIRRPMRELTIAS